MKQHPLSAAFPSMSPEDLSALTDDIARNGQRQPITVFEGMVLDGWHRYSACVAAGVEPATVDFDPDDDPVSFVLSMNLSRRHLSGSQRAAAVVACSEWKPTAGRPGNSEPGSPFSTNKQMAEKAEVSERVIMQAKAAQRAGLGDAVRDGKMSAKAAAQLAKGEPAKKPRRQLVVESEPEADDAPEADASADERLSDIVADYESLLRIVEADDKLAAAWDEAKTLAAKLADLERLYDAKCRELAEMTKEAKRWMRKAQAAERGAGK